jgi:hypothetical protein
MKIVSYLYNHESKSETVDAVLTQLQQREEEIEIIDIADASNPDDARREAMLRVGEATRIGSKPDGVFDASGNPDFSRGVLITEADTGRRSLHVGKDAVETLVDDYSD